MEQFGIVGLIKHTNKFDAPGVAALFAVFVDEYWNASIDGPGQVGVSTRTKDGAGAGIWIKEFEVTGCKPDVPIFVA